MTKAKITTAKTARARQFGFTHGRGSADTVAELKALEARMTPDQISLVHAQIKLGWAAAILHPRVNDPDVAIDKTVKQFEGKKTSDFTSAEAKAYSAATSFLSHTRKRGDLPYLRGANAGKRPSEIEAAPRKPRQPKTPDQPANGNDLSDGLTNGATQPDANPKRIKSRGELGDVVEHALAALIVVVEKSGRAPEGAQALIEETRGKLAEMFVVETQPVKKSKK